MWAAGAFFFILFSKSGGALFPVTSSDEGKVIRARIASYLPTPERQNTRLALPFPLWYLLELEDGVTKAARYVKILEEKKSKKGNGKLLIQILLLLYSGNVLK